MNRTPIASWCWSCFALGRGLVNGSAAFKSVCTLQISMSPFWTFSRMELKRRLMCLVFLWNLGSLARAIAPVLSQKRVIGPDALGMTPRSVMNSFIHIVSCAASEAAMYSASHVDPATTLFRSASWRDLHVKRSTWQPRRQRMKQFGWRSSSPT